MTERVRPFALEGYDVHAIDELLYLVSQDASGRQHAEAIWELRRSLRSQRPEIECVWTDAAQERLDALLAIVTGPAAEIFGDVQSMLQGAVAAIDLRRKWKLAHIRVPFDPVLEFSQFLTTNSFQQVKEAFRRHVSDEDPFDVIVRGQLWIEQAIVELVKRHLIHSDELEAARLSSSQYLSLASALGVVAKDERVAIAKINRLRNRLAHDPQGDVTEKDQRELYDVCSPRIRSIAFGAGSSTEFPAGIAAVVAAIVIGLHKKADMIDAGKRYNEYLSTVTSKVLSPRTNSS